MPWRVKSKMKLVTSMLVIGVGTLNTPFLAETSTGMVRFWHLRAETAPARAAVAAIEYFILTVSKNGKVYEIELRASRGNCSAYVPWHDGSISAPPRASFWALYHAVKLDNMT